MHTILRRLHMTRNEVAIVRPLPYGGNFVSDHVKPMYTVATSFPVM